jgi:hypothetical protein
MVGILILRKKRVLSSSLSHHHSLSCLRIGGSGNTTMWSLLRADVQALSGAVGPKSSSSTGLGSGSFPYSSLRIVHGEERRS